MAFWTFFGLARGNATARRPGSGAGPGQDGILGMPRYKAGACAQGCDACVEICPTKAITLGSDGLLIDYGRCIACQLCVEACPTDAITPSQDWAFAVRERNDLLAGAIPSERASRAQGVGAGRKFRRSLHVRHVDAGSCNGCESELQALNNPFYNLHQFGIFFTPSPRAADVLLITGPVTTAMRDAVLRTYEAMPDPKWVIAAGTCAVSGGIAGGGYACGEGVDGLLPVDIWLPGCAPNPAAIIEALLLLQGRTEQQVSGGHYGK